MPLYRRPGSPFWWVRLGRKTRQSTGTTERAEAEEFEERLRQRLWRLNKLGDRGANTWGAGTERWLNGSRRKRARDRWFIAWLTENADLDSSPISAVADPDALEELRKLALEVGWSHSTVDRMMRTVRAVLRKAWKEWRWLDAAPYVPMFGEQEGEPRYLTPPQFERLCRELPEHLEIAARFSVHTLLRMRSQSYLTWSRVDLATRRAWIPGAQMKMHRAHGFPLSTEATKQLRRARRLSPEGERVFQYEGVPIDNFNTAAFRKASARAGLEGLRWHDLRHTGASWALQAGVTLQELQMLGDWKTYRSVLRYAHLAPQNAIAAAERVAHWGAQRKRIRKRL